MASIDRFAVQYSLVPRHPDGEVAILLAAALDQWHAKKKLDAPALTFDSPASGQLNNGGVFRWAPYSFDGEAIADYSLRHPDPEEPSVSWLTRVSYAAFRESPSGSPYVSPLRHYLTVQVSVEGPDEKIKHRSTGRPSFVGFLDEVFTLSDGDLSFQKKPRAIPKSGVGDFVQYTLEDPRRRFPIVVLSEKKGIGFLFDPVLMGKLYYATAHVYTLGWREALSLSSEVGTSRSVFHGAMRVYFPGFRRDKSPSGHPLVPFERLQNPVFRGRLATAIVEETVAHFAQPVKAPRELVDRRIMAYDEARTRLATELRAAVPASELSAYQEILAAYEDETADLRAQLETANRTIEDLNRKVGFLRHALSQVKEGMSTKEESAVAALLEEEPPASPLEAVERAARSTSADLLILPTAYETAEESGYPQPKVILDYLEKMATIAASAKRGALGVSLRDAFAAHGIDYAPKNAENTKASLRNQYRFKDGNTVYICEEHLRRGNDPALGLRIYFTSESPDGRFVVGHVGRHLDSNSTN